MPLKALRVNFPNFLFLLPVEISIGNRFWLEMSRNRIFRPQKSSSVRISSGYASKSVQTCIHNVARQVLDIIQLPCEGYDHRINASDCDQKIAKKFSDRKFDDFLQNPEIRQNSKEPTSAAKTVTETFDGAKCISGLSTFRKSDFCCR